MTCCDQVYFCPTSGEKECAVHGGFDTCCVRPDLHREAFVAAALAAEREKARAPFLALMSDMNAHLRSVRDDAAYEGDNQLSAGRALGISECLDEFRRAAEEGQQ